MSYGGLPNNYNSWPDDPEKKKLAVVLGGWHYPYAYYKQVVDQKIPDGWECDYFVVSHRDPELPIVFEEKQELLKTRGDGLLQTFDREAWIRKIAQCHWSFADLRSGIAWQWMKKYLK